MPKPKPKEIKEVDVLTQFGMEVHTEPVKKPKGGK